MKLHRLAMPNSLPKLERRDIARRHLDAVEAWLRLLVHHQLREAFGADYFESRLPDGSGIIPKSIRTETEKRIFKRPEHRSQCARRLKIRFSVSVRMLLGM